jgi:hypothetical protein
MRTREDHLEWCKQRARKHLDKSDLKNAVTGMADDLAKHRETGCNPFLLIAGMVAAHNGDFEGVRRWVEGFR